MCAEGTRQPFKQYLRAQRTFLSAEMAYLYASCLVEEAQDVHIVFCCIETPDNGGSILFAIRQRRC